jgi:queuine/archaeosine tRNA-ribosyltransferase
MIRLMEEIRKHITAGTFAAFRAALLAEYRLPDQDVRHAQKEKRRAQMANGK